MCAGSPAMPYEQVIEERPFIEPLLCVMQFPYSLHRLSSVVPELLWLAMLVHPVQTIPSYLWSQELRACSILLLFCNKDKLLHPLESSLHTLHNICIS
jgi:hypothetical protein